MQFLQPKLMKEYICYKRNNNLICGNLPCYSQPPQYS